MIGVKLQQLRKQRGYSLRKLAKKTGLSHGFICDIEHGRCNPSLEKLGILAKALEVRPEFFLIDLVANDDQLKNPATEAVNQ